MRESWKRNVVLFIFDNFVLFRFSPNECSDSVFSSGLFESMDKSYSAQSSHKNAASLFKKSDRWIC